jgi:hypothetical protein
MKLETKFTFLKVYDLKVQFADVSAATCYLHFLHESFDDV